MPSISFTDSLRGAQALCEHPDIAAAAEQCVATTTTSTYEMASLLTQQARELLPKYDHTERSLLNAIKLRRGHCYHRSGVIGAIAIQIPTVSSCVVVRNQHAYNAIATPHDDVVVIIENDRADIMSGDSVGTYTLYPIDPSSARQDLEFYGVAKTLRESGSTNDLTVKQRVERDKLTNWHITELAPDVVPNMRLFIGGAVVRFLERSTRVTAQDTLPLPL